MVAPIPYIGTKAFQQDCRQDLAFEKRCRVLIALMTALNSYARILYQCMLGVAGTANVIPGFADMHSCHGLTAYVPSRTSERQRTLQKPWSIPVGYRDASLTCAYCSVSLLRFLIFADRYRR